MPFLLIRQKLRRSTRRHKWRMIYEGFDFKNPDYSAVFRQRLDLYNSLKAATSRPVPGGDCANDQLPTQSTHAVCRKQRTELVQVNSDRYCADQMCSPSRL